jgi:tetratricopeptide (TPR) repeat protein
MKAEHRDTSIKAGHRKELKTNALAAGLNQLVESIKEGPSRTTWVYIGIVALAVSLFFIWRYFSNLAEAKSGARWVEWQNLSTPQQLDEFIKDKDNQGTMQNRLARLQSARSDLYLGLRDIAAVDPHAKTSARESLRKAGETYDKLIEEVSDIPPLQEEALLGAARAYESLAEFDKAKGFYERLVKEHGNSLAGKEAKGALERFEKNPQDYKNLAELAEAPKAPSLPPDFPRAP